MRDNESTLKNFQGIEIGGTGAIESIEMRKHFDNSNCYILCSSKYCSEQTMREFEDADSCIEIINVELFYEIITNTLIQETKINLKFEGIFEIEYQDREEKYNGIDMGYYPSQIKGKKFESQGELRAIWQPLNNEKIDPIIIVNCKIAELCRPIFFD